MKKIETKKWYNSDLDSILSSDHNEIFIKAKLVKRVTYGEYLSEPKNGFELDISSDGKTITLDLDRCNVFVGSESRKAEQVEVYDNGVVDITYADGKTQVCRCEYRDAFLEGFEDFEVH